MRATYEAGNYSGAILDSINYFGDIIRDKSGLDSDGISLVGPAFSGANPIIRINSLHTQSNQDEQKGVHFLLMGIYSAIRNPRSHEKRLDTQETANAIICFVDYILGLIDKARSPFDADQTIAKVFDPLFGQSVKYADLVVAKVPARKLLEILIQVFHRRSETPGRNVELFVQSALNVLAADEQSSFWQVASEALENASSDPEFRTVISIAQGHWEKITDIARLRTEHRLIESIREGEYDPVRKAVIKGSLGTWAVRIVDKMELKNEYKMAVSARLLSPSQAARAYAYQYHFDSLRKLQPTPWPGIVKALKSLLKNHDQQTYNALAFIDLEPFESEEDKNWIAELKEAYAGFESTQEIRDEDIPF